MKRETVRVLHSGPVLDWIQGYVDEVAVRHAI